MSVDVLLSFALVEVKSETALNLFKVYVGSISSILSGSKEVAVHLTSEVEDLADLVLCKIELVSGILNRSFYVLRNIEIGGCSGNCNGECLGLGLVATSKSSGKSKSNLLLAKSDSKLAILADGVSGVVNSPSDLYVVIVLTNKRKLKSGILVNGILNGKTLKLCCELLVSSLLYELKILEAIYRGRNDVGVLYAVKNKDTGNVCSPTELLSVSCINGSLIRAGVYIAFLINGKVDEVGNVGSYVALLLADGEVEILAGILLKILSADVNTLDYYGHCNEVGERITCCELLGNVNRSDSLNGLVYDLEGTVLDFLHAGVRLNGTGNGYGHTNLDACLCRIRSELVAVVTALAACVHKVEVVVLVVKAVSVDTNNDTLNGNGSALLSCHILLEGDYSILGNGTIKVNGSGSAVGSGDKTGELISLLRLGLLINVYEPSGAVINKLNELVVNRPINSVNNAANSNLTINFIVSCGNGVYLVVLSYDVLSSSFRIEGCIGINFAALAYATNVIVGMGVDQAVDNVTA